MGYLLGYRCGKCGRTVPAGTRVNECPHCAGPLMAYYDIDSLKRRYSADDFFSMRGEGIWRFAPLLPDFKSRISLGEGNTPLIPARNLAELLGVDELYIKDESQNPTGSFKARGMAAAVSRLVDLRVEDAWLPSAGNAALALSAYAAKAGISARVYIPAEPKSSVASECSLYGAKVTVVPGILTDAAARMEDEFEGDSAGVLSTFREPARVEGKKTMAFELAEMISPDWILFPTGGGTGIVAMWKAYNELEQLGWLEGAKPRLVSVQSSGCAPIVKAFEEEAETAEPWPSPCTFASGINVPSSRADSLILAALRESGGTAVAVSDEDIALSIRTTASLEGIFFSPEGAATVAALKKLLAEGKVGRADTAVLFNTASGVRYAGI